ncbi:HtaA domain-containing protein [Streptomyces sp. NPDC003042]
MSPNRRPIAVAAAVLTAAALGTTAFMLPATAVGGGGPATGTQAAAPVPVLEGTLDWGVLESFRDYVKNTAKGTITTQGGATQNADGSFRFVSATGQYDAAGHVVTAAFKGSVTFDASAHGFIIKLENFRFDTGTKKLTADVIRNGALTANVPLADVAFAGMNMAGLATTLTPEFAAQFTRPDYAGKEGDKLTAALEFPKPSASPSSSASASASPSKSASPSASASKSASASASKSASASASTNPSQSASSPAAGGPQQILSGKLAWGVKESFREYVLKSGGTITPEGGAAKNDNSFSFSGGKGTLDSKTQKLNASFQGSLRFQFPAHGIDMTFGNVRINAEGAKGTLVLDVRTASGTKADVSFATLDLTKADYRTKGGVLALNAVRTALTADGAAAFANEKSSSYKAGERLDDVNLSVSVDKDAPLPSTTTGGTTGGSGTTGTTTGTTGGTIGGSGGSVGGNLATTGAGIPAGALLGASGAVVAAGAGAVFIARRRRTTQN